MDVYGIEAKVNKTYFKHRTIVHQEGSLEALASWQRWAKTAKAEAQEAILSRGTENHEELRSGSWQHCSGLEKEIEMPFEPFEACAKQSKTNTEWELRMFTSGRPWTAQSSRPLLSYVLLQVLI